MIEYGINTYGDITSERIKQMTDYFNFKDFFSEKYRGIAVLIITPKQYLAIYSNGENKELNHDRFIDIFWDYIYKKSKRNPTIVIELTHIKSLDQCIIQLPEKKFTPISNKMNRLKMYFEKIIRYYQPKGIQSESSDDLIFVKKYENLNCEEEEIVGIDIDRENRKMRAICKEIHRKRSEKGREELKNGNIHNR